MDRLSKIVKSWLISLAPFKKIQNSSCVDRGSAKKTSHHMDICRITQYGFELA